MASLSDTAKLLIKECDQFYKQSSVHFNNGSRGNAGKKEIKALEAARELVKDALKSIRTFHGHAEWLVSRFPDAELVDVEGLVKLVSHEEIEANDWSLTPGRYVGVAPEPEDEDFDFVCHVERS